MAGDIPEEGEVLVRYYLVCLVDILRQRQRLERWARLPPDGKVQDDLVDALKSTVGTVLGYRDLFMNFFSEFSRPTKLADRLDLLSDEDRQRFARIRECAVSTQQFSDTFVFYTPVTNRHGDTSGAAMYQMLTSAASLLLVGLASGAPVRGSIALGAGMEIEPGNFYGPALATAHSLESEVAEYPRVVLSEEAANLAFLDSGFSRDPEIERISASYQVQHIRPLVCRDSDGRMMVDFMGGEVHSGVANEPEVIAAAAKAYDFVCCEVLRQQEAGNNKLAGRYARLLEYMEPRLAIWGIEKES